MERYMKIFATSGDVQTAINNGELSKPYVAYIEDGQYVDWNSKDETDYSKMYLTFEMTERYAGILSWIIGAGGGNQAKTIEYSLNGGEWTSLTSSTSYSTDNQIRNIKVGDLIRFRGNNDSYANNMGWSQFMGVIGDKYKVYGNIMSLIYGDNFSGATSFPSGSAYNFKELFYQDTSVIDASKLILPVNILTNNCYHYMFGYCNLTSAPKLPATTLADSCYREMFFNCTGLTSAPELPATVLTRECYSSMFNGCTNLNSVTCLATDISAYGCTTNWLNNVSSTGTFVTPSTTNWSSGASGIPNNWTRVNA